ncbi:MAG: hypothetical protein GX455_13905 [Phycisphaerae bacterium]|nr:hypothetical protein [Phycisphaerae bacterium]
MKTLMALSILSITFCGCIVVTKCDPCKSRPCTYCPPVVINEPIIAEINAACSLISESDKFQLFAGLASRPGLSDNAQIYLVRKTSDCFISETNKFDIIQTLIHNPVFSPAAKAEILNKLNMFISESSKHAILDEFNRMALNPPPPAQISPPAMAPAPTNP